MPYNPTKLIVFTTDVTWFKAVVKLFKRIIDWSRWRRPLFEHLSSVEEVFVKEHSIFVVSVKIVREYNALQWSWPLGGACYAPLASATLLQIGW